MIYLNDLSLTYTMAATLTYCGVICFCITFLNSSSQHRLVWFIPLDTVMIVKLKQVHQMLSLPTLCMPLSLPPCKKRGINCKMVFWMI